MKRILITGATSYVGTSFKNFLNKRYPDQYSIKTITVRNDLWKSEDFSQYNVILHVAAIVHVDTKKFSSDQQRMYYKVNRDLPIEIAKKAKAAGVPQFIFMSSMSVYGDESRDKIINRNTATAPSNLYGKSKLQAEEGLKHLEDEYFKIVLIRPPMIYGKDSKGNYSRLSKLAKMAVVFPDINNKRSMLYIENLCYFIKLMIDNEESGTFFPQNKEYIKTSKMVQIISKSHNKNIIMTTIFNPIIYFLIPRVKLINKMFGNLVYDKYMSQYKEKYQIIGFKKSIIHTEGKY